MSLFNQTTCLKRFYTKTSYVPNFVRISSKTVLNVTDPPLLTQYVFEMSNFFLKLISSLFYTTFTNFPCFVRIYLKTVLNVTYLFYLPHYMRILIKTCLSLPFYKIFTYMPHFLRIYLKTVLNVKSWVPLF